MTPDEKKRLEDFNGEVAGNTIKITLVKTLHEQSDRMENFCDELSKLSDSVKIRKEKGDDDSALPAITVKDRLLYRAIPEGKEQGPFLEVLKISADDDNAELAEMKKRLSGLTMAASFEIFISPHCPFCPLTVRTLAPMAFASELIRVSVIDAGMFPDLAAAKGVRSVPMTFLDESFSWTGTVNLDELIDMVKNRDPSQLGAESLKNMIHEGMAARVAEMMDGEGKIFPAFVDLLTHEKWPVRLGAMVTAEELAARNRKVAARLVEPVWEKFHEADSTVKGDLLYVIGEAGDESAVSGLISVRDGDFGEEVREAASEALERVRERIGDF